ncbi:hypothetical protein GCM10007352_15830 [Mucilaginibacter phyllosphaerae]|nr:hypothetical protein GCM10007352_15830 [Mucilaginibacter phyllosphaerae]
MIGACSKKESAAPANQKHTIKITASANAEFTAVVSVAESIGAAQTEVKNITVATGTSFEFTTEAITNSYVFLKLSTNVANNITYKIADNGIVAEQGTDVEFATRTTQTIQHLVQ